MAKPRSRGRTTPTLPERAGKAVLVIFGTGARDNYLRLENRKDVVPLFVDAGSELLDKGLVPDCEHAFSIDYYLANEHTTYEDLEAYVLADPTFGSILKNVRDKIFSTIPVEGENWPRLSRVGRDTLGGGGLVYFGALRLMAAMVGRSYQSHKVLEGGDPNPAYDMRDDPVLHPSLKKREPDVAWVSLYDDLWEVFDNEGADFVCFEGGFDGATGSSGTFISHMVFGSSAQIATMPVLAVALPEYFLVDGSIHPDHADRLNQTVALFDKVVVVAGLGGEGIFWQAVADNMRTWAGVYSNLEGISLRRKCVPVLLVGIATHRRDLEARWVIYQIVTKKVTIGEAKETLLFYAGLTTDAEGRTVKTKRLFFEPVQIARGYGVRIAAPNGASWPIHEWEELAPALAAAGRLIGNAELTLPVRVQTKAGGLFAKAEYADRELPVESVPILRTLALAAGKDTMSQASSDVSLYALTMPEKLLIGQNRQNTFDRCFQFVAEQFKTLMRDYLYNELLRDKITPPSSMTYDDPQTVVAWAQPNIRLEDLADLVLDTMFAVVDREEELRAEEEHEATLERRRRQAVQQTRKHKILR